MARLFDEIAASVSKMEFARTSSRRRQQDHEGLPEHWRKKLQRNPELYEDPDQTVYVPPSPEVLRKRAYEQEREQLVTALKGLILRTETYDWWDEQTINETIEGQFNSYWRYNELNNKELALILEQRGGFETLSAEMQQKIREGKLGDHPEDDPDYLKFVVSQTAGLEGQGVSEVYGAVGAGVAGLTSGFGKQRSNNSGSEDAVPRTSDDFVVTLKGEKVHLEGVKVSEIIYTKRHPEETAKLRKEFDGTVRKKYLQNFANDPIKAEELRKAGLSEADIARMQGGLNPKGWQVHHKLPLDDGGTNSFDNLILIKNDPYHKAITNAQNALTRDLAPGANKIIMWPIPEGNIYPTGK